MSSKRILDVSSLMRPAGSRPASASLPGVHGLRVVQPTGADDSTPTAQQDEEQSEPAVTEEQPNQAVNEEQPKQDVGEGEASEQVDTPVPDSETRESDPAEPSTVDEPAQKKSTGAPGPAEETAPDKPHAKTEQRPIETPDVEPDPEGERGPEELESLDGRPARLWDISDGRPLPAGWARIAIERVHRANRRFKAIRRNTDLPNNIYAACNEFIYQEVRSGGLNLTLSQLAEAAFEQIPQDDEAGIRRLLDGLPDKYFEKGNESRPRTFQLFEPTVALMQNLAPMLRAQGFTGMTGLVQAAVLRELLIDLGVDVD